MVPEIDYKLKCYSPKRQNVLINWISLNTTLKEDRRHFQWVYDQLIESMVHPTSSEAQTLLGKYLEKGLKEKLMKRRQELITKGGYRFKIANQEQYNHHVKILSHYFIRGIDPLEWPRNRDMDPNLSEVRRGGLDIYYAIDQRDSSEKLQFEADRKSKL